MQSPSKDVPGKLKILDELWHLNNRSIAACTPDQSFSWQRNCENEGKWTSQRLDSVWKQQEKPRMRKMHSTCLLQETWHWHHFHFSHRQDPWHPQQRYILPFYWTTLPWEWLNHDNIIKCKHFPRCWPFVRWMPRSQVDSIHKCQWRETLIFSLSCAWTNGWANNRDRTHYITVTSLNYSNLTYLCPPISILVGTRTSFPWPTPKRVPSLYPQPSSTPSRRRKYVADPVHPIYNKTPDYVWSIKVTSTSVDMVLK